MTSTISRPYKHGTRYRCRIRTEGGSWKWAPSAATPEAAEQAARRAAGEDPEPAAQPQDPPEDPPEDPPARTQDGARLEGPYRHRGRIRYRVVTARGRSWAPSAKTQARALKMAEETARQHAREGALTVKECIAAFLDARRQSGCRPITLTSYQHSLECFFRPALDQPIVRLTPRRGADLYEALRSSSTKKHGGVPATASTIHYLRCAKALLNWAQDKGWVRENVLARVKAIGKAKRGKPQLTIDEARKFYSYALDRALDGDDGAAVSLVAVSMGLRASEIASRTVRDLDDGGRILRVCNNTEIAFRTKTDKARTIQIPADLRPVLARCAKDKLPGAFLFPNGQGGQRSRQWIWDSVRRICEEADVPHACPHSLRGVSATAAAAAGALPELVAAMLGHSSPDMTRAHYIAPGTSEAAQLERGHKVLTGR